MIVIGYIASFLILISSNVKNISFTHKINNIKLSTLTLKLNILFFILLLLFSLSSLYINEFDIFKDPYSIKSLFYIFKPIILCSYLFTLLNLIFPISYIVKTSNKNKLVFFAIYIVALIILSPIVFDITTNFWSSLLLVSTIKMASFLSSGLGMDFKVFRINELGTPIFGSSIFNVEIVPACSGYEGMTLVAILLGFYCYLQRSVLRIPRAVLFVGLAIIGMFLLNAVRLVILISIGHFFSPSLALNGFHSVGGWLNLLIILILSFLALNHFPFFIKDSKSENISSKSYSNMYFLVPLMVLIASSLFSKALTSDFYWLYPIPILITIGVIFLLRKYFSSIELNFSLLTPFLVGIIVFFIWIYLVPVNIDQNQIFLEQIQLAPIGLALIWILLRILGSSVIVPIAEEFAFRGFLLPKIELYIKNYINVNQVLNLYSKRFNFVPMILSIIVTSFLFGILHSEFFAGSIAGLAYSLIYLYRRKVIDAVIAHSVTNTLLVIDIIYFGNWSYW